MVLLAVVLVLSSSGSSDQWMLFRFTSFVVLFYPGSAVGQGHCLFGHLPSTNTDTMEPLKKDHVDEKQHLFKTTFLTPFVSYFYAD